MGQKHHGPGALAGATEAEADFVMRDSHEHTAHRIDFQDRRAIRLIASRFALPLSTAAVIAELAQIGKAAA